MKRKWDNVKPDNKRKIEVNTHNRKIDDGGRSIDKKKKMKREYTKKLGKSHNKRDETEAEKNRFENISKKVELEKWKIEKKGRKYPNISL